MLFLCYLKRFDFESLVKLGKVNPIPENYFGVEETLPTGGLHNVSVMFTVVMRMSTSYQNEGLTRVSIDCSNIISNESDVGGSNRQRLL